MNNIDEYFIEENIKPTKAPDIRHSDDNKYRVVVSYYTIGTPEKRYWNFTRGKVYSNETDELLFDIKRNYSSFYSLFLHHTNGNDYMVCGRDYHGGYSILDLTNRKEYCYEPETTYKYQQFFCWIEPSYSDFDNTLDVEGCFWGAEFEIVEYDFSDPTVLPLKEIHRHDVE